MSFDVKHSLTDQQVHDIMFRMYQNRVVDERTRTCPGARDASSLGRDRRRLRWGAVDSIRQSADGLRFQGDDLRVKQSSIPGISFWRGLGRLLMEQIANHPSLKSVEASQNSTACLT